MKHVLANTVRPNDVDIKSELLHASAVSAMVSIFPLPFMAGILSEGVGFLENIIYLPCMMVLEEETTTEEKKASFIQYNAEGKHLEAFLGPLEANILQTMWDLKKYPITVREVLEKLKQQKSIAYTTVMNTMDRLYEKGILDRKIEKSKSGAYIYYVYWPKLEEINFKETAIRQVLGSLLDNFGDLVTACLVEKAVLNDQELEALKERVEKNLKEKQK